jgi:hypothetical protein
MEEDCVIWQAGLSDDDQTLHTHTHTHRQTSLPFPFTEEFEVPAKGFTAVSDRGTVELELELDPRFEGKG